MATKTKKRLRLSGWIAPAETSSSLCSVDSIDAPSLSTSGSGGHRACAVKLTRASCERFTLAPCRPSGCFYPERHEPTSSQNLAGPVRQARQLHRDDMVRLAGQACAVWRWPECLRPQARTADRRRDQAVRPGDKPQRLPGALHGMRRPGLRCARRGDAPTWPPMGWLV